MAPLETQMTYLVPRALLLACRVALSVVLKARMVAQPEVGDSTHVVSLYADDALVSLRDPEESTLVLLSTLTAFGEVSGLCVIPHKSHLLPMGGLSGTNPMLLPEIGLS
ncbi:hypothetical protein NDU88_007521 [Pleurodeles waltl]|uniref:Reverse transcriptase domain-containing protein n=1 Tax=Pleurodeles waltl TaxID=8319 RepID=A0AAV7SSM0_PLEWA|nr:hypothetical protein NDU88_007521 [Pleurodeles waltl]